MISVQQWDFFQEHGYLIVENVISDATIGSVARGPGKEI